MGGFLIQFTKISSHLCLQNRVRLAVLLEPMTDVDHLESIWHFLHFTRAQSFLEDMIWVF